VSVAIETRRIRNRAQAHLLLWLIALVALLFQVGFGRGEMALVLTESLLVVVFGEITIARAARTRFWSPASLFFIVLSLFHVGLALFWIFGIDPGFVRPDDYIWYQGDAGIEALTIVSVGLAAYVLGFVFFIAIRRTADQTLESFAHSSRAAQFSSVGAVLTIVGVIVWFFVGYSVGGVSIFFDSYANWLSQTGSSGILPLAYGAIGLGLGLTVIAPARRLGKAALLFFGVYAVVAFFLGLRGDVLFPLAVAVSVIAFRRRMPSTAVALGSTVGVLLLISAVKTIRQIGVAANAFNWTSADPLSAIGEMGQTLRVVAVVSQWHAQGEHYELGATYTVSIARLFEQLFEPQSRLPAASDFRLMNSEIMAREGPIGGSVVAEAYHNFAIPGVVVVLLIIGIVFAAMSNMRLTAARVAVYVCVGYALFGHIRNSFVPVIPTVLVGCAIVLATSIGGDILSRKAPP